MIGLPIAFATPAVLLALVLLPAIWWLLRVTPPRPRMLAYGPTRSVVRQIGEEEKTPAQSPWWLTALRLLLAAAVIIALAGPIYKPSTDEAPGDGPLLIVVENGWSSSPHWPAIVDTARRVIRLAEDADRPLALLATAESANQDLAPTDATEVLARLDALAPRPFVADHMALLSALASATDETDFGGVVWLSDGVGGDGVDAFATFVNERIAAPSVVYKDDSGELFGLRPPEGQIDALVVPVVRRDKSSAAGGIVRAFDLQGRVIGEMPFSLAAGASTGSASFSLPVELRNEIVRVDIAGADTAAAVQLLDDRWQRRRVGLLSGTTADTAQPLLSPLYYLSRAIQPFADVREPREANAAIAVPELIEGGASVIAMADIGTLNPEIEETVGEWVRDGGTLVRFAGPRLAAATDSLIPVRLRHGDRILGGSLTWQTPQPLASFADNSPFASLPVPDDVVVKRQVLAEPDASLASRTWASLADGTPLVTATQSGKGWLILFHVTADASWSNLPLSGAFVEMLRRIIAFSSSSQRAADSPSGDAQPIAPWRLIDGYGRFAAPGNEAQPIVANATDVTVNAEHPPGLYGSEEGFRAINLLDEDAVILPFEQNLSNVDTRPYPTESPKEIGPWLMLAAFILLILDAIAVLWLAGSLRFWQRAAAAGLALFVVFPDVSHADEASDRAALEAVSATRLAYVVTGNAAIDEASYAGLRGLSSVLADRTALEPGDPIGVDPATDELAFYPLIYWPIDPEASLPTAGTMSRIDAYMRQGGSVLFDTRDHLERSINITTFSGTPALERLRDMLSSLDVPPLEPVPADHVLTKAFYLLNDFPGRYSGGPLWVEATQDGSERADRPAQAGDGVSTILITENDFASAWATDERGEFLYPTVSSDPLQREMAFRTGINIVMYTLTGNYKADQVHVPALLERLGQ
jgi:Domain of unknown function (DUF4159)/Aerotolerance regulator N-terminal